MIVSLIFIFALKVYFYVEQLTKTLPGILRWSWFRNLRERVQRTRRWWSLARSHWLSIGCAGALCCPYGQEKECSFLPLLLVLSGTELGSPASSSCLGVWELGLPVGQDGGGRPCTAPRPSLGGVGLLILQTPGDIEAHDSEWRKRRSKLPIPSASPMPWLPDVIVHDVIAPVPGHLPPLPFP